MKKDMPLVLKYLLRLAVVILLWVVYQQAQIRFREIEKRAIRPRQLVFRLPLPQVYQKKYNLPPEPEVEQVIAAGFFSDWSPTNQAFRMHRHGPKEWRLKLSLDPGENQYKFVVHVKGRTEPAWCHNPAAAKQVNDSYGGLNSVLSVPDIKPVREVFNTVVIGLMIAVILFMILQPLLRKLLVLPIPFRFKIVIGAVVILLLVNLFYIYYNHHQTKELVKHGFIDSIHQAHRALVAEGVDFTRLGEPETTRRLQRAVHKVLWTARARGEVGKNSPNQIMLESLLVFDHKLRLLVPGFRYEAMGIIENEMGLLKVKDYTNYVERLYRLDQYRHRVMEKDVPRNGLFFTSETSLRLSTPAYQATTRRLGFQSVLYPIIKDLKLRGYYIASLNTTIPGNELQRILTLNLVLLPVMVLLALLLLYNTGRVVTSHLHTLTEWTRSIVRGDFERVERIKTGDEIESLSKNFNQMRLSLGNSVRGLRLMSRITSTLHSVESTEQMFVLLLAYLVADTGFHFDRAAVFLREGDVLQGNYACGYLSEEEIHQCTGCLEDFQHRMGEGIENTAALSTTFADSGSQFRETVKTVGFPVQGDSVFQRAFTSLRPVRVFGGEGTDSVLGKELRQKLRLFDFVLFPIRRAGVPLGVLLVDNCFSMERISGQSTEQVQIVLNDFSNALARLGLVEELEQKVAERTRELRSERNLLRERNNLMEMELELARTIQASLIPTGHRTDNVYGLYKPVDKVGGDFFDFVELDGGKQLGLFISDVSGHGVPAAFITSMLKNHIHQFAPLLLDPSELLVHLNDAALDLTGGNFITAFYGIYERKSRRLNCALAGHQRPYIISTKGIEVLSACPSGFPLAVMSSQESAGLGKVYQDSSRILKAGEKLLLFTDGLSETRPLQTSGPGKDFAESELPDLLPRLAGLSPEALVQQVYAHLVAFRGGDDFEDDVCLVCLEA